MLAVRSDFYSTCARYPWLAERISENQILVGPMQRHELRRAIEGPALRAGLRLEDGLTEAFLEEAGDEPGALPLAAARWVTWPRALRTGNAHASGTEVIAAPFARIATGARAIASPPTASVREP